MSSFGGVLLISGFFDPAELSNDFFGKTHRAYTVPNGTENVLIFWATTTDMTFLRNEKRFAYLMIWALSTAPVIFTLGRSLCINNC